MKQLSEKEFKALSADVKKLVEQINVGEDNLELYKERLAELELALEDRDWNRISGENQREFSRYGLRVINQIARLYWLKNPLIRRAVLTQTQYVFGRGMNIQAVDSDVNKVIQKFLDDPKNKVELTEHQSRMIKETELQLFGNLFFVFFVNQVNGQVKIRTIPTDEIEEIYTDPDDNKTPQYYKRVFNQKNLDTQTAAEIPKQLIIFYRDWKFEDKKAVQKIADWPVEKNAVIYHVAVNRLSDMKFGISEVYASCDWAKAYKEFLEDWATIVKAYSRFAWRMTTKGGKGTIQRAKTKLESTMGSASYVEENPPPVAGSTFIGNENVKMDPIRTSGATTSANDGEKLIHMVCAATGIFYHYLTGDPSSGNLATAKTMERPMELMFRDRQQLWTSIFQEILNYVIEQSVKAPKGVLKGITEIDDFGDEQIILDGEKSKSVNIVFPDILDRDINGKINAIVSAATLDGKPNAGTLEITMIVRLLLEALGIDNIDEVIDRMFPKGEPSTSPGQNAVVEAVKELKGTIEKMVAV